MDADFWHQRWAEGQIGFHQSAPTPLMLKHWPSLDVPRGARVFVPLCGKSLDMAWFASQGYRVLGIELSSKAVEQFFAEHGLAPEIEETRHGSRHRAGPIEIIVGDAFALDTEALLDCAAVFDRAALVALPPELRARYADALYGRLPAGCRGLLITLEYPQEERAGPPFSVPEGEVCALYGRDWRIETLDRREIPASHPDRIRDTSHAETAVYRLDRR